MGLSSALNSALSGLRVSQAQIDLVSQNVANADTPGYNRRRGVVQQSVAGERTTGVRLVGVERQLDQLAQRQLRVETSAAAYTNAIARSMKQVDAFLGGPGEPGSFDSVFNDFTGALQQLASTPGDGTSRAIVIDKAQLLASTLNGLTDDVQDLRGGAEAAIAGAVPRINELLGQLKEFNLRVSRSNFGVDNTGLLDERDRVIQELSQFIDFRAVENAFGAVTLYSVGGVQLVGDDAVTFEFDQRSGIDATDSYSTDPAQSDVGTLMVRLPGGGTVNAFANRLFRSGEIAALVELRDRILPQVQDQLDQVAAALAASLSDRNPTTAVTVGPNAGFDINLDDPAAPGTLALKAGNTITVDVQTAAGPRRYAFIAADAATPNPLPPNATSDPNDTEVRLDLAGGIAGIQAQVQATLGAASFTVSVVGANGLRILNNGAGNRVAAAKAGVTNTALQGSGAEFPLFSDPQSPSGAYTGAIGAEAQRVGFAGRIILNPAVATNPDLLVKYAAGTPQGDTTRPTLLLDRLTRETGNFGLQVGTNGGITAFRGTVADMTRRLVENQTSNAAAYERLDAGQQVALRNVEARNAEASGVSVDEEMADLVQLQNAYAANARIISAVRDLLDTLLRI
jgi:flagellar hook-associated protein 1 FlgK